MSETSMLSPFKGINDAAATSSLLLTINWYFLTSGNITTSSSDANWWQQLTKNIPGNKPMVLDAPWDESYLEHQLGEQSSMMFIYQWLSIFLCVLLYLQLINTMWTTINLIPDANQYVLLLPPMLIDDNKYPTKKLTWINPMEIGYPWAYSYPQPWGDEQSSMMFICTLLFIFMRVLLIVQEIKIIQAIIKLRLESNQCILIIIPPLIDDNN